MDIKDLAPDQLADFFRKGQRAAEQEQRHAERKRLEEELQETKRRSAELFDRRAALKGEIASAEERVAATKNSIAALEEELESAKRELQQTGHQHTLTTREARDLARAGRRLEEALDLDLEARGFAQHGWYSTWPNSDHDEKPEDA
jgi:chromosome segregation ATPase